MSRLKKDRLKNGNLFVPLVFSFGAALEGMSLAEFLEEPTKISNTLRLIQSYFQVDGLICYADTTVLAESLGCSVIRDVYPHTVEPLAEWRDNLEDRLVSLDQAGRIAIALEVTKRLNIMLPEAILMGLVTGPLTLARQLSGQNSLELLDQPDLLNLASKASLAFAKAWANAGIDILIIWEEDVPTLAEDSARLLGRCYSPIWNTAKFFDLSPLMMVKNCPSESINFMRKFVDGF
ncbi:MAG: uroporphyrinogen decarboxylase family protein, partial [Pseudomonadota bacterium]